MNILFQFNYSSIIYAVTSATTVTQSTTSGTTASTTEETIDPDQDVTNADDDNLGADINDDFGTLLGPLVEIVRAIGDAIMSILTKCMLGTSFESMMVSWDEVDNSKLSEANTSKTYTESEINEFKNAFGNLPDLKYPNFKYTPEEIFKGEIDVFGIDFIGGNTVKNGEVKQNESTGWNSLRKMVSTNYSFLSFYHHFIKMHSCLLPGTDMVIRTFSYPFCRYPYIAGFNASQTYRYILNIITFTENLFRSKGPFSCLIESFIITGYRNLYQARFMYSHTITGYATNSEGIHLLHLLHIYSKRDRIIIRPRTPFKVRILQASTYPVSQKFLIRITSRHRFGGCQIPTNRKRQCLSHLSAFHKSSTFKIQCLFYGQFFFIKR